MESSQQQLLYVFLLFTLCLFFLVNSSIALNAINSVHSEMTSNSSCAACLGSQCGGLTLDGVKQSRNAGIASVLISLIIIILLGFTIKNNGMFFAGENTLLISIAVLFFVFIITSSIMFSGMSGVYDNISKDGCGIDCVQKTCKVNICSIKDSRNSLITSITTCSLALAIYIFLIYKKVKGAKSQ